MTRLFWGPENLWSGKEAQIGANMTRALNAPENLWSGIVV